jgi:hypothetical protein
MTSWPPVVYVGPSLHPDDVRRRLPGCQLMPPIRRGDLYRDRLLGFRVFVVLDGVFAQELAISPREMIDIARDGALVMGACSMGAMRAAECWPAGVRGVGSIYRLFRRGALTSDAEVAVAFSPDPPYQPTSVPMINVRYALSRCVRDGILAKTMVERVLRSASGMFFSDRTWPLVLSSAGLQDSDGSLRAQLQRHDLKRLDAIRALDAVRRWVAKRPGILRDGGTVPGERFSSKVPREESHALNGFEGSDVSLDDLWRWLVATGRYRRYAFGAVPGWPDTDQEAHGAASALNVRRSRAASNGLPRTDRAWMEETGIQASDLRRARQRSRTSPRVARLLVRPDAAVARAIWADITVSGDRDALVFAFTATVSAARWARRENLQSKPGRRRVVMTELARAHGFPTWSELERTLHRSPIWPWIEHTVDDTVRARQVREQLFSTAGVSIAGATPNQDGI